MWRTRSLEHQEPLELSVDRSFKMDPNDEDAWEIKPEHSIDFEPDDGHDEWQQEVFEHQSRGKFENWPAKMSDSTWLDLVLRSSCKCSQGTSLHIMSVFMLFCSTLI